MLWVRSGSGNPAQSYTNPTVVLNIGNNHIVLLVALFPHSHQED